ncbi:MAG: DUF547 domain-containing protein [Betaproteobacteria bacterium]|nr:DUF547 domain-containing protein [Betaproteobacteria bacterium]
MARGADVPGSLAGALHAALDRWYDSAAGAFDYRGFRDSVEYRHLAATAVLLASFDCTALGVGKRMPFWLNVYNALVLHAVISRAIAGSVRSRADFFSASAFRVAGQICPLDAIEHGLLRGNAPRYAKLRRPLAPDDARLSLAPFMFDERVHFALHAACRSSPRPRVYYPDTFSAALEEAACAYLALHVRVEQGGAALRVPRLFQWYANDFGGERGVREFVIARLAGEEDIEMIARSGGNLALRYAEFDWALNEPR